VTSSMAHHDESQYCLNCSAAVDYHYCAVCGQETKVHVPSASEFIHEFVGHYVALEGRLWKTLAFLLCRPGFLTAEYIEGRRVRYVEPLRVYLTFSILFFFIFKLIGPPVVQIDEPSAQKAAVEHAAKVRRDALTQIQLDPVSDIAVVGSLPGIGLKINKFFALPATEQMRVLATAFFSYVPYAMFCLMPLFALYLKVLYLGSGRRYGEHLLFALHTNAFAFAMFSLLIVAGTLDLELIVFLMVLWLVIYLPKAMRRVYGGSRWATALRWMVLATAHIASVAAAIITAFSLAILG
jgi:hypothetical protein